MAVSKVLYNIANSFDISFFEMSEAGLNLGEILPIEINGKFFLPVEERQILSILVKSSSHKKFELCTGVDGVSVMAEEPLTYKSRGYLLRSNDVVFVNGYRISDNVEAAFVITYDGSLTVASQTTLLKPEKRETIEFHFWEEKVTQTVRGESPFQERRSPNPETFGSNYRGGSYSKGVEKSGYSSDSYESQATAGMGMGRNLDSPTHEATFNRASNIPFLIVVVNYLPAVQIEQMIKVIGKLDSAAQAFPLTSNFQGVRRVN